MQEKLICPKCGEQFPATTERGPGPAKAKFAAHVNKCEGKGTGPGPTPMTLTDALGGPGKVANLQKEYDRAILNAVDAEPLKVGDQVLAGTEGPAMTIAEIGGDTVSCSWQEGGETHYDAFLLETLRKAPTTLEEAAVECAPLEITVIKETLKVPLSDEDYKDFAIKMGHANLEISAAEDSLASVKSQFKARIDAAVAKRNEYASIINAGCEYKPVECQLRKDYARSTIEVVRMDTYERVSIRNMTSEERQRGLDFMERQAEVAEA